VLLPFQEMMAVLEIGPFSSLGVDFVHDVSMGISVIREAGGGVLRAKPAKHPHLPPLSREKPMSKNDTAARQMKLPTSVTGWPVAPGGLETRHPVGSPAQRI
jgi:hypothetical protein